MLKGTSLPWNMGPIRFPETSVKDCHTALRNVTGRCGSLKSCKKQVSKEALHLKLRSILFIQIISTNSLHTSQRTHGACLIKAIQLMLFKQNIFFFAIRKILKLCAGKSQAFFNAKAGDGYI
jgi:hypothetical protein